MSTRERLSLEDIKVHMASGQITEWVTVDAVAIAEAWKARAEAAEAERDDCRARAREYFERLQRTPRGHRYGPPRA
jgi:hypothetical protein